MGKLKVATSLIQEVAKYTKTGCRLISKERQLLSSFESLQSPFSMLGACKEVVKVETAFGKGSKTITSYFDVNDNKLVGRIIQEYQNGKEVSKIIKKFNRTKAYKDKRTYNIFSTKSAIYKNGVKSREIEDKFVLDSLRERPVTHLRFDVKEIKGAKRLETQLYEELIAGSGRTKYLETTAKRLRDGRVINKTLSGNLDNMDEIAKDPYLYIRNYKPEDFATSVARMADETQRTVNTKIPFKLINIDREMAAGYCSRNEIAIDLDKHYNYTDLVNSINHEYRHKHQNVFIDNLKRSFSNMFKASEKRTKMSFKEKLYALRCYFAETFYCHPEQSRKLYHINFKERDARKAGSRAAMEYGTHSWNLAQNFSAPYEIFKYADDPIRLERLKNAAILG